MQKNGEEKKLGGVGTTDRDISKVGKEDNMIGQLSWGT